MNQNYFALSQDVIQNQVAEPPPHLKCGACGIAYSQHHIVNHNFVFEEYRERFCPLCKMLIHDRADNFERHYRNCGMEKPYEQ
jgi:hypothetical protein